MRSLPIWKGPDMRLSEVLSRPVDQAKVPAGLDKARQDLGKIRPDRNGGRPFDRSTFETTTRSASETRTVALTGRFWPNRQQRRMHW